MNANLTSRSLLRAAGLALFSSTLLVGCGADDALNPEQFPEPIAEEQISTLSEPLTATEIATLRAQILTEINKARAVARVCGTKSFPAAPPLARDSRLDTTAQAHSVDMATKNYFSHTGLDGRSPFQRMTDAGYRYSAAAENIAAGNSTAAATVQQWIKSSGHCANLMSATYIHTGIGYGYSATSTYKHYWTQNFGRPL
ncbi:MAG TPA: CAP domain-containing protein [Pseudomonadota bacterium]|nr:CAP domain-containing protein [Pseudomonadota bacterium]